MKTDRQSLEALEERLNDPELYVDAIDDAVDVIIQLERERDSALQSAKDNAANFRSSEVKRIEAERKRDGARASFSTALMSYEATHELNVRLRAERDQLRKAVDELAKYRAECNNRNGVGVTDDISIYFQLPHVIERNKQ